MELRLLFPHIDLAAVFEIRYLALLLDFLNFEVGMPLRSMDLSEMIFWRQLGMRFHCERRLLSGHYSF